MSYLLDRELSRLSLLKQDSQQYPYKCSDFFMAHLQEIGSVKYTDAHQDVFYDVLIQIQDTLKSIRTSTLSLLSVKLRDRVPSTNP
jgi:hypothetical protein